MKLLFIILIVVIKANVFSQDSVQRFNYTRNNITIKGMKVLAGWGIANIGIGATGWAAAHNTHKYFYQMNTLWGAANTGLAVLGVIGSERRLFNQLTVTENLKAQQRIEKVFFINAALDVVYTGAGLYLNNQGNNRNNAQLKGFGSSVIMQGIFLFLFDGTMYNIQRENGKKFKHKLSNL